MRPEHLTSAEETRPQPSPGAQLRDHRPHPEGVVPKQSQAYVIAGVAILILFAVMFSNKHARTAPHARVGQGSYGNDANRRDIEELKRDLTEDQRKIEQQEPAHARSSDARISERPPVNPEKPSRPGTFGVATQSRDAVADEERSLLFKARFASNLVPAAVTVAPPSALAANHHFDSSNTARETAFPGDTAKFARTAGPGPTGDFATHKPEVNVNSAYGPPYVLFEGTTIDTALLNRLDAEFAGPVKVMVTTPVYSEDRQHVLIPEGTLVLGEVRKVSEFGQKRLAVFFHRMLMPDGYSIDLDQFPGLDQAGETGLKDKVNHHYLEIFGTSIALGIIAGAAEQSTTGGLNASGSDLWRQGVASSLSQSSANILDRFINVPPTLTIREGHRIKVYFVRDLLLPAYENHSIPPDI
jgi:type IV secretory pathway VirB10-like protein